MSRSEKLLRSLKLKTTPTRLAILVFLQTHHKPVSAQTLAEKLGKNAIDQATVYRNLTNLEELGVVRRVELKSNRAFFELKSNKDHHHIICVSCGLIEDFYNCNIDKVAVSALKNSKRFAKVSEHSLELFGLCKQCEANL